MESGDGRERVEGRALLPGEFLEGLKALGTVEEKLEVLLSFMRRALEGGDGHHFREFWEARKLCGEFFTQPLHPLMRTRLWSQYTDICHEARVLKNLFDEQSSFVSEQIEKAIETIEAELPSFHEKGEKLPPLAELATCPSLQKHVGRYEALYHELQYLNSFASRIASLRKELLKTEMRFKQRHKLLDRLSKLGDAVFPKRKQAISEVSVLFVEDVEAFVRSIQKNAPKGPALIEAREEIKRLQGIAKELTLGTDAFTKARAMLGECWESIKEALKEKRKAEHERREAFKKHRDELLEEIAKVKGEIDGKKLNQVEAKRAIHGLQRKMREVPLSHQDVVSVREQLRELDESLSQPAVREAKSFDARDDAAHAAWFKGFLDGLKGPFEEASLEEKLCVLSHEADEHVLSRVERLEVEEALAGLRDQVEAMRTRLFEAASDEGLGDELFALERLQSESKKLIDLWRKETSGSESDFSLAMRYTDLIQRERGRMQRMQALIDELSIDVEE